MAAKRGGRTQAKRSGGIKTGLVLLAGLVIGLGLAAAYLLFGDRQRLDALLPQPNPQAQAPALQRDREPVAQDSEVPRTTYDFYTVLPEREVELPGGTAQAAPPAATAATPNALLPPGTPATAINATAPRPEATPASGLLLQAGAFSNGADAEALRAKLALLGQRARIETVHADGRTLHRVRLGPFADAAERAAMQARLAEAGISATPAR